MMSCATLDPTPTPGLAPLIMLFGHISFWAGLVDADNGEAVARNFKSYTSGPDSFVLIRTIRLIRGYSFSLPPNS